ncbi:prepilin peptidase [Subtercola lobariae]|uniref:Prepilin type IV endopeptidase peptidase domain-containing protein n=1 Tax=Subtercola lobariae TaxID=1588641 RepID=A0A917B6E1_9MICO|nr:prepilin peptidase [Subtercola lobariae]GGF27245.1 hypothetical protein GCM10011399_20690 [Subtercola lobariae]
MLFWLAPLIVIAGITAPLVMSDVTRLRLPNRLILVGYVAFACAAELHTLTAPSNGALSKSAPSPALVCLATLVGAGGLWMLGAIGMGDVKLMGLLAGCLQLLPSANAPPLPAVAAGATLLLIAPAALLAFSYGRHSLPLGPFLLAGFWLAVLVWAGLG